ncbi:GumC family protein [Sunxiuqinia sp. A32]|uniref:GumC family protein n=1 Tax=Sunxiuqinia sp. A32 TaxID=3461496 RepID=UPI0040457A89
MVSKIEEINRTLEEKDTRLIKEFLYKILRKWYWFVLAVMLGGAAGYYRTETTPSTFSSNSLILIKEEDASSNLLGNVNPFMFKNRGKIENYIGTLTSYSLNRKALDELGWFCEWYIDRPMLDQQLYGNEPFSMTIEASSYNLQYTPIYIKLIGDNQYQINVDATVFHRGREMDLVFSQKGELGVPFESEYFNFTLYAKDYQKGFDYYFILKDMDYQTMNYISSLTVEPLQDGADMINLQITDNVPQKAVDYLNELNRQFIKYGLDEKNRRSRNTIDFIDRQLSEVIDTLGAAGRNLTNYRSKNQIVDLSQESGLIVQQLVQLDTERSKEKSSYDYFINLKEYLNDTEKMKQVVSPSVVGITDASLNSLVVKLSDLYSRKEVISYTASEKNPTYILIEREIELAQKSLRETLDNLIDNSKFKIQSLDERIAKINSQMSSIPQTEQDLMNMKRMFDLNNDLYTFLLQKRAEAAINHASNQPDAKVLDPARITTVYKVGPSRMINMAAGVFLGGMIPLIVLMLSSYFNEKLTSAEEIEGMTEIPIIGNIIHNPYSNDPIPAVKNPRSAIAESLRELRTNLRFLQPDGSCRVMSTHSVIPGEGKTFTTLNIATILAMNNKRVLLIDADLRKPSIHSFLDLENKDGLSTYLVGAVDLDQIRKKTKVNNLTLIPGGPIPPSPSELIENDRFKELLDTFRDKYDYIIIDNPPLTLVSDGINMSYHSDMNLFVLKQDYSSKDQVKFLNYVTKQRKMKNPGIVFNDINTKKYVYAGYYGSKYNYKNSYGHYYHK